MTGCLQADSATGAAGRAAGSSASAAGRNQAAGGMFKLTNATMASPNGAAMGATMDAHANMSAAGTANEYRLMAGSGVDLAAHLSAGLVKT